MSQPKIRIRYGKCTKKSGKIIPQNFVLNLLILGTKRRNEDLQAKGKFTDIKTTEMHKVSQIQLVLALLDGVFNFCTLQHCTIFITYIVVYSVNISFYVL